MNTQFNLVGFFARHTRDKEGKVTQHPQIAVTLKSHITAEEAVRFPPSEWEATADRYAVQFARYSPFEKKWMIDWQLVPVEINEERVA